ncbi:hypothetical protein [Methylobacterium organophilum]|uniref:Scaffolding protein n=1 Tax=Methylobacterium organophilum TaxID=410 RepID=A0ABQ4TI29_METOR|nr:hypothetical protein [Methylobacterium organophilum]GJE29800.1 hypothetical protein LKMONMHP_4686 [Methylobacterium organophilum]
MNDHADTAGGDDAFTPEEQAAFEAYERGEEGAGAPAGGSEPVEGGAAAPAAPPAAAAAPGDAAAPGEVVDPENEEGSAEENKGKFVRHGAFHQERERRKATERELAELRERFARGDERLRVLTEAMQKAPAAAAGAQPQAQAAPEPEKVPDPNEDIFGYVAYLQKELTALRSGQQQMTEAQTRAAEDATRAAEERQVLDHYRADVQRLAQAEPAFVEAYGFLVNGRVAELKHFGLSDEEAVKAAQADEMALIHAARQRGVSPAQHVYDMAKLRGFAPKPAAAAAPVAPAETPAEKAARVAAGQAAAKSLSSAGGAPAGEITLEMLAAMSEEEFDAFQAKNPAKVRKLMGGE